MFFGRFLCITVVALFSIAGAPRAQAVGLRDVLGKLTRKGQGQSQATKPGTREGKRAKMQAENLLYKTYGHYCNQIDAISWSRKGQRSLGERREQVYQTLLKVLGLARRNARMAEDQGENVSRLMREINDRELSAHLFHQGGKLQPGEFWWKHATFLGVVPISLLISGLAILPSAHNPSDVAFAVGAPLAWWGAFRTLRETAFGVTPEHLDEALASIGRAAELVESDQDLVLFQIEDPAAQPGSSDRK